MGLAGGAEVVGEWVGEWVGYRLEAMKLVRLKLFAIEPIGTTHE